MPKKTEASLSTAVTTQERAAVMQAACNAYYRAAEDVDSLRSRLAAAEEKAERLRLRALEVCGQRHNP